MDSSDEDDIRPQSELLRRREEQLRQYNDEIESKRQVVSRKAEELKAIPQVRQPIKAPVPVQQVQRSPPRTAYSYDESLEEDEIDNEMVPNPDRGSDDEQDRHLPDDDDVAAQIRQLGAEPTVRFHRARAKALQEQLNEAIAALRVQESRVGIIEAHEKELQEEKIKLQKQVHSLETQVDKHKKRAEEAVNRMSALDADLIAARKEIDSLQRGQKKETAASGAKELKINRLTEELEKAKIQLREVQEGKRETMDSQRKEVEQLLADKKKLERQKTELINAFKKQAKLIDILRRQKIHMEAAKLLSFTEEEFNRVLASGSS